MKTCSYCGKEYPDDVNVCAIDGQPLALRTAPPPALETSQITRVAHTRAHYASFWPRLCAGIVDSIVFWPVSLLDDFLSAPERGTIMITLWTIVGCCAYPVYSVILHAKFGQTLGKMAMKIQVVDVSEQHLPKFRQAFLRDIGNIFVSMISLVCLIYLIMVGKYTDGDHISSVLYRIVFYGGLTWFWLEIATMLTNKKRRALHDFIAGTVVVQTTNPLRQK